MKNNKNYKNKINNNKTNFNKFNSPFYNEFKNNRNGAIAQTSNFLNNNHNTYKINQNNNNIISDNKQITNNIPTKSTKLDLQMNSSSEKNRFKRPVIINLNKINTKIRDTNSLLNPIALGTAREYNVKLINKQFANVKLQQSNNKKILSVLQTKVEGNFCKELILKNIGQLNRRLDSSINQIKVGQESFSQLFNNTNNLNSSPSHKALNANSLINNKQIILNSKDMYNNKTDLSIDQNVTFNTKEFINSRSLGQNVTTSSISSLQTSLNKTVTTSISDHLSNQYKFSSIANDQQISYQFTGNKIFKLKIINFLETFFLNMSSIISRPILDITHNKVRIHLFLFTKGSSKNNRKSVKNFSYNLAKNFNSTLLNFLAINKKQLDLMCGFLSKNFKRPVELELIKIHNPIYESNILSKIVAPLTYKMKFYFIFKKFLSKIKMYKPLTKRTESQKVKFNRIPSFISGLSLKLAGRALRQPIRPKFTVQHEQQGSVVRGKASYLSKSRFTSKNKRGAFSITVSIGQNFF